MANKIKVIFCTDGIFPHSIGGMQRHSRLLIEALAKTQQLELVVIHPHSPGVFDTELLIKEIEVAPIDVKKNYLLECYRYSKKVYAILANHPQHLVYSQGLSVWYNIKKVGRRLIVNPHGLEAYQCISLKDRLISVPFKLIFNHIFKNASVVISLGGKLTEILKENIREGDQKIVTIPNAVSPPNTEITKTFEPNRLQVLFIARFAHNKGIHILMQAIKELNEEGFEDKLTFTLGGKGPLFTHYSTTFTYSNVKYLGFVSDEQLVDLYSKKDLFVLPTLFEGMPTVVLEAMSYGLPIIVSDVGATRELVNAENGYLIERNETKQLKQAIINFYELTIGEKERLSRNSINRVQQLYTWTKVAAQHLRLFEVLNSKQNSNIQIK